MTFQATASSSTLVDLLARRAVERPNDLAFDIRGDRVTWARLFLDIRRAAAALAAGGAAAGAPCGLALPTGPELVATFFGAQLLGALPVAMNPRLQPAQVARRLDGLGCSALVADGALLASLPSCRARTIDAAGVLGAEPGRLPDLDALADGVSHLQITSGTTGEPRAVTLRHRNVMAAVAAAQDVLDPSARDVMVGWLPLHHDLGLVRFVLESIYFGTPSYLLTPSMAALPKWLETIARVRGTITAAPDFAYRIVGRLVDPRSIDLRPLRIATNGGEVVRQISIRTFEEQFGVPGVVQPGYGLAEATLGVTLVRPGASRRIDGTGAVSCGRPLPSAHVRIGDADHRTQPAGVRGRILVQGPTITSGYWNDPDATAAILHDGWLDTGDIGWLDADGELYVLGRTRAMIKRAGATIAPREIEELADELPGVRRSAAVGLLADDDSVTEDVFVVAEIERSVAPGAQADMQAAIADVIRRALGFAPREVRLVPPGSIPRTTTGKTQYEELRRQLAAGLS